MKQNRCDWWKINIHINIILHNSNVIKCLKIWFTIIQNHWKKENEYLIHENKNIKEILICKHCTSTSKCLQKHVLVLKDVLCSISTCLCKYNRITWCWKLWIIFLKVWVQDVSLYLTFRGKLIPLFCRYSLYFLNIFFCKMLNVTSVLKRKWSVN